MPDNNNTHLTGYPSIDKPWLKYYSEEALTQAPLACSYTDYLLEENRAFSDGIALEYMGREISYGQVFESVLEAAKGLAELGIQAGDIIPIFSVNTPETIYTILALNRLGAVPCLEYVTESVSEAMATVRQCKAKAVVVLDVLLDKFGELGELVEYVISLPLERSLPWMKKVAYRLKNKSQCSQKETSYSEVLQRGKCHGDVKPVYEKDMPAVIVHSGGTTGVPKGVVLSNENITWIAWAFHHNGHDAVRGDKWFTAIPLFHAFGFCMGMVIPLSLGQRLSLTVKYDEETFVKSFLRIKPNHTMSSSTYLPMLIADPLVREMDLSFYKTMGMGGTPVTESTELELCEFMQKHGSKAKASLGYGMSELSSAACTELNRYYGKVGSVGIPLCGVNIRAIHTEAGTELPYGGTGELHISSPGLMLHYYQNEEETQTAIYTDESGVRWIKTGDIGYIDEDGFVFIIGRLKRIYTTRTDEKGAIFHIFPDYITGVIAGLPEVRECAVVCIPHKVLKSIPLAFVVLADKDDKEALFKIEAQCRKLLPEHSRPKAYYPLDSIPKTEVGKPDYKHLEIEAQKNYEQ